MTLLTRDQEELIPPLTSIMAKGCIATNTIMAYSDFIGTATPMKAASRNMNTVQLKRSARV